MLPPCRKKRIPPICTYMYSVLSNPAYYGHLIITKDALKFGSENPLMRSNFLFHVKRMLSIRRHNSSERVIAIFLDYE